MKLEYALNQIREKVPLSRIVGQDVALRKKGREFVGNCPFHNEKTGSFFVSDEKGAYHCFGCGASGDVFSYVMEKRGLQFMQAVELLAGIAGVKLPEKAEYGNKFENQQKILQKALEFFKENLNDNIIQYCVGRGINRELIEKFSIGYAPFNGKPLMDYLKKSGFEVSDILSSGLFLQRDNKTICYFKERLIFPVFNKKGWPIAFGGRAVKKDVVPKYLNSPETELFQKKETLYAYNIAVKNVSKDNQFIVVEGYVDVVMMHKHGFNTTVASMGTALTAEHLAKIWRYSNEPIICLDGDEAGYNAMVKAAVLAMKYIQPGKSLKFCLIPNGDDPDSFLNSQGKEAMEELIANSAYLIDFIWERFRSILESLQCKTPEKIAEWKGSVVDCVNNIQNSDVKRLYRAEINDRIYRLLRTKNNNSAALRNAVRLSVSVDKRRKTLLREATLLYIIIMRPSVVVNVAEKLSSVEFSRDEFRKIRDYIVGVYDQVNFSKCGLDKEIAFISSIASRSCNLNDMDDSAVLNFWKSIFELGFSKKQQIKDILSAKKDCGEELNSSTWRRLKALKIDSIDKTKKHV
ncbi:MAG: DNA primase [Holosporales bacterium]|jgi:DNA primase|nr:DNA primase [Holosporales bacterium]